MFHEENMWRIQIFGNSRNEKKCIHEELKYGLNSEMPAYHPQTFVFHFFSSSIFDYDIRIIIHRIIVLPVVLRRFKIWYFLPEEDIGCGCWTIGC
jgi:hypothetical protein